MTGFDLNEFSQQLDLDENSGVLQQSLSTSSNNIYRYRLVAQRLKDLEDRSSGSGDNSGSGEQQLTEEVINQEAGELAAESLVHENRDT